MAEQADSGDRRRRRRLGVVTGKRAARKKSQADTNVQAKRAGTQRSQNE